MTALGSVLLFLFRLSPWMGHRFLIFLEQLINFVYDRQIFGSVDSTWGLVGSTAIWLPRHLTCFGCSAGQVVLGYLVQAQVQDWTRLHNIDWGTRQWFNSAFLQSLVRESQLGGTRSGRHATNSGIEAVPVFGRALQDLLGPRRRNQVSLLNVGLRKLALWIAILKELRRRGPLLRFVHACTDRALMQLVHHLAHLIILRWLAVV